MKSLASRNMLQLSAGSLVLALVQCGSGDPQAAEKLSVGFAAEPLTGVPAQFVVVPTPNSKGGDNHLFDASGSASDDVWASNIYLPDPQKSPNAQTAMLHWDGSAWSEAPTPNPYPDTQLRGVATIGTRDAWAVGFSAQRPNVALTEHWDGTRWSNVQNSLGQGYFLLDVAAGGSDDVWAVGDNYVTMHWDGKKWSTIPGVNGVYELYGVSEDAANDVWAVGYLQGSIISTFVQRWNGKNWTQSFAKNPSQWEDYFEGVAAIAPNDVWAVGAQQSGPTQGVYQPLIEHWDGQNWAVVPSPQEGDSSWLLKVRALGNKDVWAFGLKDLATLILHWDGKSWTEVASQSPGTQSWFQGGCAIQGSGAVSAVWGVGTEVVGSGAKTLAEKLVQ
jgi:hypothetical protein